MKKYIKRNKGSRQYKKVYYDPATNLTRHDKIAKARYEIETEVTPGKPYDYLEIIADMGKRLNMIERGFMLMLDAMKTAGTLPPAIENQWTDIIEGYIAMLNDGSYKARTDLAEDNFATFQELMRRDNKITTILERNEIGK